MKKALIGAGIIVAFSVFTLLFARNASAPSNQQPNPSSQSPSSDSFDKQAHPIDEPGSLWWIVNKVRPISPITYAPSDLVIPSVPLRLGSGDSEMRLRREAATALENLVSNAKKVDIDLLLVSGYHSYQLQVALYNASVQANGQAGADKELPRPGVSENQTGLAADLGSTTRQCEKELCFADLPEGKWLQANAYKYGFIVRYPENKTAATGYQYEPWHIRYVGPDLSIEMYHQNVLTLEEFFGIVPAQQPY